MNGLRMILVVLLGAACVLAADTPERDVVAVNDGTGVLTHVGAPIFSTKADTVYVFGGPGTLEGKFQTPSGGIDAQGWTGRDDTVVDQSRWHVDTFGCEILDPMTPGNHAWWCGEMIPSCDGLEPEGGYGNNWKEWLDWNGTVADNMVATDLSILFDLVVDSEPGYDGTKLQYRDSNGLVDVMYWDGADTLLDESYSFTMMPEDYAGDLNNEVQLRFEFRSDGAWSDEDCLHMTSGAARIDNIAVYFDGLLQGAVEDCENASSLQWTPLPVPGVGDYFQIWPLLGAVDPCRANNTPVAAFLDDGVIVPGTGGSQCWTWCYSTPEGWVLNSTGGLAGSEYRLRNWAVSPVISWPAGDYDGGRLQFDVYRHFITMTLCHGYRWMIRSTTDPAGLTGWSEWRDHNFFYFGGDGWARDIRDFTSLLEPGCANIQVSLGVFQLPFWCWGCCQDVSPAPYFDNVCVVAHTIDGPSLSAVDYRLAQDGFPDRIDIDYENLGANSIRFDMAQNISPDSNQRNDPGDSLVVGIKAVRPGSTLLGAPRMYYRFGTNALFNAHRDPAFTSTGYVDGQQVFNAAGYPVADQFSFDLPDTGWFYPGDVIHYYFEAQDDWNSSTGTSILPADTAGFSTFGEADPVYDAAFTVRGLPTVLHEGLTLFTPSILLWNDADQSVADEWQSSMENLGYRLGYDYDLFCTRSASRGLGNGLGGRATAAQVAGYDLIMYSSGVHQRETITDADFDEDAGGDVELLDAWLRLGDRNLFLTGDGLVSDMASASTATATFLTEWMGVSRVSVNLYMLVNNQRAPIVRPQTGNTVITGLEEWIAYGSCPSFRSFDAVDIAGTGRRLANFLDPDGQDVYTYSAATLNTNEAVGSTVISLPYDFSAISTSDKAPTPSAARTRLLEEILAFFEEGSSGPPSPVPELTSPGLQIVPNPFNPQTQVSWSLPKDCRATIDVLDLRGRVVRTLVDNELVGARDHRIWDGRNQAGSDVASGVYFARVRALDVRKIVKLTLVR